LLFQNCFLDSFSKWPRLAKPLMEKN